MVKKISIPFGRVFKFLAIILSSCILLSLAGCQEHMGGVLNPKGIIAFQERKLLFDAVALMLIVVLPVIIMSFTFVYHYQISHKTRDYKPNWSHNVFLEAFWWGIPCAIILVLGIVTWKKTHKLDPFQPIEGAGKPMIIEAIALPWKWLFIYPEQKIATLNYLEIPRGRQVEFWLTADNVPMSAFFIPQLGSQIYTMAGMRTRLHLIASATGTFEGMNTQYNGDGFSDMHFTVNVVEPAEMQQWVAKVKSSQKALSQVAFDSLLTPTVANKPELYAGVQPNLFDTVIKSYLVPGMAHPRIAKHHLDVGDHVHPKGE